MMVVRGTKKFLDRVGRPTPGEQMSDGVLGDWYANALMWRPQVALFVNERTFLPVLVRLAPAMSVLDRFPAAFARIAGAIGVNPILLDAELATMTTRTLAKTASRHGGRRRRPSALRDPPGCGSQEPPPAGSNSGITSILPEVDHAPPSVRDAGRPR